LGSRSLTPSIPPNLDDRDSSTTRLSALRSE
jgi:hypothetical protein